MIPSIRKLRDSDRNDVLEISKHVWEGHDYLPSVFDKWLRDVNSHFYGIELDDRIVAVGNLRLVESGSVGWMEGLRVHPDYRGRGLANMVTQHFVDMAKDLRLPRLRLVTGSENLASLKLSKNAGFSIILRMAVSWISKPKAFPEVQDYVPIKKRSPRSVCTLLKMKPRFIPHRILAYEWKALNDTCPNIREIGKTHAFYAALKNNEIDSLSFGYPRNPWWNATIYAKDSQGFLAQLSHNMTTAFKQDADSIECTYQTKYEKTLKEADLKPEEQQQTHFILLEKQTVT